VKTILPQQKMHVLPPRNQQMLNIADLDEEQKQKIQQILNPKENQTATQTS
jgi:Spy/CpxP family protein refolding chaperone